MRVEPPLHGVARIRDEARLLYTLLDAADSAGIITGTPDESIWHAADARLRAGETYEAEAERLHDLLAGLDVSGALRGTWIEERWRSLQHRVTVTR
jgi:hypothetical protein